MLILKKGKKKTQIFTVCKCNKCGEITAGLSDDMAKRVEDKYDTKGLAVNTLCTNCCRTLSTEILSDEEYKALFVSVILTMKDGRTKAASEDDIFIYV